MTNKRLTTTEAAAALGVCPQRIAAKINSGHFPHAGRCECGRTIMIPVSDIDLDAKLRGKKRHDDRA